MGGDSDSGSALGVEDGWPGGALVESLAANGTLPAVVLAANGTLPAVVLAVLAVGLAGFTTYNFVTELANLRVSLPPAIAAIQGYGPAFLLAYAAARLSRSEFTPVGRWRVSLAAVGGMLLFGGVTVVTLLVRWTEGRVVGEPRYVVFATAGAGALAGLLMGVLYARSQRDAEAAASTRDQFELMNSILRHDILNRTMIVRSRANFIADHVEGRPAEFADTIVAQSDDISDQVERTRALLDALSGRDRDLDPVSLSDAVETNVETLRATHEPLELTVDVLDGTRVLGDDTVQDVVGNVLSNAVEHNDKETVSVHVGVETTERFVDLRVADNGPGVDDAVEDAIFRRDHTDSTRTASARRSGAATSSTSRWTPRGSEWVCSPRRRCSTTSTAGASTSSCGRSRTGSSARATCSSARSTPPSATSRPCRCSPTRSTRWSNSG
nr:ATP-binding protein [Halorarius litoreus]